MMDKDTKVIAKDFHKADVTACELAISPFLLDVLVCPVTKDKLYYDKDNQFLVSQSAKLMFPIVKGVPIMLVEEAKPFEDTI